MCESCNISNFVHVVNLRFVGIVEDCVFKLLVNVIICEKRDRTNRKVDRAFQRSQRSNFLRCFLSA